MCVCNTVVVLSAVVRSVDRNRSKIPSMYVCMYAVVAAAAVAVIIVVVLLLGGSSRTVCVFVIRWWCCRRSCDRSIEIVRKSRKNTDTYMYVCMYV